MIDMRAEALRERLKVASAMSDLTTTNRLRAKVDYAPEAVAGRLREVEKLRRVCLRLAEAAGPSRVHR